MPDLRLPAQTVPPDRMLVRGHSPSLSSYPQARSCLRWDFAFTCAFCLLHESDLAPMMSDEPTTHWWIEHFVPKSAGKLGKQLSSKYENLLYSCRWCNRTRGIHPNTGPDGQELLNPCDRAWSSVVEIVDDEMRPASSDASVNYTWQSYGLGDARKTAVRRNRRAYVTQREEVIADCTRTMKRAIAKIADLIDASDGESIATMRILLDGVRHAGERRQEAMGNLGRLRGIPKSAPTCCECSSAPPLQGQLSCQWRRLPA